MCSKLLHEARESGINRWNPLLSLSLNPCPVVNLYELLLLRTPDTHVADGKL